MTDVRHVLVLANSVRAGKHCVAGKLAKPIGDSHYDISDEWIRLNDPRHPEGAVSYTNTVCQGHGSVRPLDIVRVAVESHCGDPDHPEDWHFDPAQAWQYVGKVDFNLIPDFVDAPNFIWHDTFSGNSVPAGYVRQMNKPATLYLVKAPTDWTFSFWNEWNSWENRKDTKRKLSFTYDGSIHEFSVTDADFTRRHNIYTRATDSRQTLEVPDSTKAFFCLSLTKLTSKFPKHYKICATIFEKLR
jgi:hypothetical protein